MKGLLALVAVITLVASVGESVLEACGAKFLVATRAARFQKQQRAARPANILIYEHSDVAEDTPAGVAEFTAALRKTLERVGHSVTVAGNEGTLQAMARANEFDVVMMELGAARRLRVEVRSWKPDAAVLPIARFLTSPESALIKQEFGQVLKLPATSGEVLTVVQDSHRRD